MTEGYIKFQCDWEQKEIPIPEELFQAFEGERSRLFKLGLIGMYPDGIGFGNISVKSEENTSFIITGSATGQYAHLDHSHFALVTGYNFEKNSLTCEGMTKASAESLTHAAVYEALPEMGAVVHVHCLWLWEKLLNNYPTTSEEIEYGTPEMAYAVKTLASTLAMEQQKVIIMGGHREGILAFGRNLKEATSTIINLLTKIKMTKIAIIGGSGLENPSILKNSTELKIETPYGPTTSDFKCGTINGRDVAILSRHGRQHTIPPSQVNNRANIWAIREIGCTHILATTACGSLRQEIGRGNFVILDQFIDFTRHRPISFFESFEPHEMKHTPMADPFDNYIRSKIIETAKNLNISIFEKGTVVTIEGPRFSTRAESNMFRLWGADVINMSTAPEAILANELGIPYAAIAMSTDYDCWKTDEAPVTWNEVLKVFNENVSRVIDLLIHTIGKI